MFGHLPDTPIRRQTTDMHANGNSESGVLSAMSAENGLLYVSGLRSNNGGCGLGHLSSGRPGQDLQSLSLDSHYNWSGFWHSPCRVQPELKMNSAMAYTAAMPAPRLSGPSVYTSYGVAPSNYDTHTDANATDVTAIRQTTPGVYPLSEVGYSGSSSGITHQASSVVQRAEIRSTSNSRDYLEMRRKNNEAARRSRALRKVREKQVALRIALLESENARLKTNMAMLRAEAETLRTLVQGDKKAGATVPDTTNTAQTSSPERMSQEQRAVRQCTDSKL